MKKLAFILGILILAAAVLLVGYWFGAEHRMLSELYSIPMIDKALTDAGTRAMLIEQIDSGHATDARQHLELQLDGDILTIDSLLDLSDARTRDLAQKVFARIASYRVEHPNPRSDPKVRSILERATQTQSK